METNIFVSDISAVAWMASWIAWACCAGILWMLAEIVTHFRPLTLVFEVATFGCIAIALMAGIVAALGIM